MKKLYFQRVLRWALCPSRRFQLTIQDPNRERIFIAYFGLSLITFQIVSIYCLSWEYEAHEWDLDYIRYILNVPVASSLWTILYIMNVSNLCFFLNTNTSRTQLVVSLRGKRPSTKTGSHDQDHLQELHVEDQGITYLGTLLAASWVLCVGVLIFATGAVLDDLRDFVRDHPYLRPVLQLYWVTVFVSKIGILIDLCLNGFKLWWWLATLGRCTGNIGRRRRRILIRRTATFLMSQLILLLPLLFMHLGQFNSLAEYGPGVPFRLLLVGLLQLFLGSAICYFGLAVSFSNAATTVVTWSRSCVTTKCLRLLTITTIVALYAAVQIVFKAKRFADDPSVTDSGKHEGKEIFGAWDDSPSQMQESARLVWLIAVLVLVAIASSVFCSIQIYRHWTQRRLKLAYNFEPAMYNDKERVLPICREYGRILQHLSNELRGDKEVALIACQQDGLALQYASSELQCDKDVALVACQQNGQALVWVHRKLRMDKDVVLAAVTSSPQSLKYALNGLNRDPDCLIAAKLWDQDYDEIFRERQRHADEVRQNNESETVTPSNNNGVMMRKIVLSTKFSLAEESSAVATQFTILLKQHPYIRDGNFIIYSPNAFDKCSCDPQWTRKSWPCRGTYETCLMDPALKSGVPTDESCWRYSFRTQLEEAKQTNGCMIQLVEFHEPEDEGNISNTDMAERCCLSTCINGGRCKFSSRRSVAKGHDENEDVEMAPLVKSRNDSTDTPSTEGDGDGGGEGGDDDDGRQSVVIVAEEEYALGKGQSIEMEMAGDVGTKVFQVYQPCNYYPPQSDLTTGISHIDKVVSQIKHWYEGSGHEDDSNGAELHHNQDGNPSFEPPPPPLSTTGPTSGFGLSVRRKTVDRDAENSPTDDSDADAQTTIERPSTRFIGDIHEILGYVQRHLRLCTAPTSPLFVGMYDATKEFFILASSGPDVRDDT